MLGQIDMVRESRMFYMVRRQRSGILVPQREAIRTVVPVRRVQLQTLFLPAVLLLRVPLFYCST